MTKNLLFKRAQQFDCIFNNTIINRQLDVRLLGYLMIEHGKQVAEWRLNEDGLADSFQFSLAHLDQVSDHTKLTRKVIDALIHYFQHHEPNDITAAQAKVLLSAMYSWKWLPEESELWRALLVKAPHAIAEDGRNVPERYLRDHDLMTTVLKNCLQFFPECKGMVGIFKQYALPIDKSLALQLMWYNFNELSLLPDALQYDPEVQACAYRRSRLPVLKLIDVANQEHPLIYVNFDRYYANINCYIERAVDESWLFPCLRERNSVATYLLIQHCSISTLRTIPLHRFFPNDRLLATALIRRGGSLSQISHDLRDKPDLIGMAVDRDGFEIAHATLYLLAPEYRELAKRAVRQKGEALAYLPSFLREDPEIVALAMAQTAEAFLSIEPQFEIIHPDLYKRYKSCFDAYQINPLPSRFPSLERLAPSTYFAELTKQIQAEPILSKIYALIQKDINANDLKFISAKEKELIHLLYLLPVLIHSEHREITWLFWRHLTRIVPKEERYIELLLSVYKTFPYDIQRDDACYHDLLMIFGELTKKQEQWNLLPLFLQTECSALFLAASYTNIEAIPKSYWERCTDPNKARDYLETNLRIFPHLNQRVQEALLQDSWFIHTCLEYDGNFFAALLQSKGEGAIPFITDRELCLGALNDPLVVGLSCLQFQKLWQIPKLIKLFAHDREIIGTLLMRNPWAFVLLPDPLQKDLALAMKTLSSIDITTTFLEESLATELSSRESFLTQMGRLFCHEAKIMELILQKIPVNADTDIFKIESLDLARQIITFNPKLLRRLPSQLKAKLC